MNNWKYMNEWICNLVISENLHIKALDDQAQMVILLDRSAIFQSEFDNTSICTDRSDEQTMCGLPT